MTEQKKELLEIGKLIKAYNKKYGYYHTSVFVIGDAINGTVFNDPESGERGVVLDVYDSGEDENE